MRVLIIADDEVFRAGLAAALSGQTGVSAVNQTRLDGDLATTALPHRPDVILWDLSDAGRRIGSELPALLDLATPVIVLGDDEVLIAEAVTAGAKGVLPRHVDPAPLVAAVRAVGEGLVVIDPTFPASVLATRDELSGSPTEELTPREIEVLQLLAEGLPNRQIALRLGISEHTVKFHVDAILGKLGAHTRTEAVTRAARLGLLVL
ncbi:MAG TPA: response regulator transcription factor [bacterium]|nr:response regulator transcription factor [bacterium]